MRTTEYAAMSTAELQRLDVDSNGLSDAKFELRRRGLAQLTGAGHRGGRDPRQCLAALERLRDGPKSPAQLLIELEARKHVTAHGVDPRQLILQLHAMRIAENW